MLTFLLLSQCRKCFNPIKNEHDFMAERNMREWASMAARSSLCVALIACATSALFADEKGGSDTVIAIQKNIDVAFSTTDFQDLLKAYIALLEYSQMNPKFEAMSHDAIAELQQKLDLPAVDQLEQANDLLREETLASTWAAREIVREALQIDARNIRSLNFYSRIMAQFSKLATPLSQENEKAYNLAFKYYLSGDYCESWHLILGLLNDKRANEQVMRLWARLQALPRNLREE